MSEDLFQISESQTFQLRRSQRLVYRKTSSQQFPEADWEKIPSSQKRSQKPLQVVKNKSPSKILKIENKTEDIQIELRSPTPDFTDLIVLSQKIYEENEISQNINGFNILQEQEKILDQTTQLQLKQQGNKIETNETFIDLITQPEEQTLTEQFNTNKENKSEIYQNIKNENEIEVKAKTSTPKIKKKSQSNAKPKSTANTKSTTKMKTEISSRAKRRYISAKTKNPKALTNTKTLTSMVKSNSIDISNPIKHEYEAPKIVRYYNSCPIMNDLSTFPYEHNPLQQSLLPPVYPPHFINQICLTSMPIEAKHDNPVPQPNWSTLPNEPNRMHQSLSQSPTPSVNPPFVAQIEPYNENVSSVPILPISLLTPDDSEVIVLKDSAENELDATPSTPIQSPNSLHNFFQINEIVDLTDVNRAAYILTELQIQALSCVLKIDENELYAKLDEIVEIKQEKLMEFIQNVKNNRDFKNNF